MALEAQLGLLGTDARLFLGECCAETVRAARDATLSVSPALAKLCAATLRALLTGWPAPPPPPAASAAAGSDNDNEDEEDGENDEQDEQEDVVAMRCRLRHVRHMWLFSTHALADTRFPVSSPADVLGALGAVRTAITGLRGGVVPLPHCTAWKRIDRVHAQSLEVALREGVGEHGPAFRHRVSADWMQEVQTELRNDQALKVATAAAARKGASLEHFLPLLGLRTARLLGDGAAWLALARRLALTAVPAALALLQQEPPSERQSMQRWLTGLVLAVAEDSDPEFVGRAAAEATGEGRRCGESVDALVASTAVLTLRAYSTPQCALLFGACSQWLLRLSGGVAQLPVASRTFATCLQAVQAPTTPVALAEATAHFGLQLVARNGISALSPAQLGHLGTVAAAVFDAKSAGCRTTAFACCTVAMACILALPGLTPAVRTDVLQRLHTYACDEDSWNVDGGRTLQHLAREMQQAVIGCGRGPWAESVYPLHRLEPELQCDFASVLGEMYWLLYKHPMCAFLYTDGRSSSFFFALSVDSPQLVATLYAYDCYCVKVGIGARLDRRLALEQLVQTDTMRGAVARSPASSAMEAFVFSADRGHGSAAAVAALLQTVRAEAAAAATVPEEALLQPVMRGIFYDSLSYVGDAAAPEKDCCGRTLSPSLSAAERRILHTLDLCLRDLAFSPDRADSWLLLYFRLADYLHLLLDVVGEQVVPMALPESWHLRMEPPPELASFAGLLSGCMRKDAAAGYAAQARFLAAHGSPKTVRAHSLVPDLRAAWGDADDGSRGEAEEATSGLARAVALKNFVLVAMSRVVTVATVEGAHMRWTRHPSGSNSGPGPGVTETGGVRKTLASAVLVVHGKTMLTMAAEFVEGSAAWRARLATALRCLKAALGGDSDGDVNGSSDEGGADSDASGSGAGDGLSGSTKLFATVKAADLEWAVFGRAVPALRLLQRLRRYMHEQSGSLKVPLRLNVICDAAVTLSQLALAVLQGAPDMQDLDVDALAAASDFGLRCSTSIDAISVTLETLSVPDRRAACAWLCVFNCIASFRECRRLDTYFHSSVHGLAQLLHALAADSAPASPAWAATLLDQKHALAAKGGFTHAAAFEEIQKLFSSRNLAQVVRLWSVEKAAHEWDMQLQLTYNFDGLRRKYTGAFVDMARRCARRPGQLEPVLEVLRECLTVQRKSKQTATVRWMIDRTAACASSMLLKAPHRRSQPQSDDNDSHDNNDNNGAFDKAEHVQAVFEMFQLLHAKVVPKTLYLLQRALLRVHRAHKSLSTTAPLGECLHSLYEQFGTRPPGAAIDFHKKLAARTTSRQQQPSGRLAAATAAGVMDSSNTVTAALATSVEDGGGSSTHMDVVESSDRGGRAAVQQETLVVPSSEEYL